MTDCEAHPAAPTAHDATALDALAFQAYEGMMITDARGVILRVNAGFTRVTGYRAEEAVGHTPVLLKSGRQPPTFYHALWAAVMHTGHWEGVLWNRRKDGSVYPEWLSISAIRAADGAVTHYLGVFSDMTEPRDVRNQVMQLAYYDSLTGLPNRRLFMDRLAHAVAACARGGGSCALMFLDLDNFKTLNDTDGHDAGDQMLVEVARRLSDIVRHSDTAARLGGDEFVVLLENLAADDLTAANHAEEVAEKLLAALSRPYVFQGRTRHSSVSIGITLLASRGDGAQRRARAPEAGGGPPAELPEQTEVCLETLLKQADLALYQAKAAGRNTIRFFNPDMQAAVDAHARIESGLRQALAEGHLRLLYQPQVDHAGRLFGVEALVRWQPPRGETIAPAAFIPVAEDSGLILPLGRWVLETACRQLAIWARTPATRELGIAVNISARQFNQRDFVAQVTAILAATGADPARLKLELTESLVVDVQQVIGVMNALRALGVSFAMDDFGTGHSSLANLKRLPLEELKIDQGFVRDIPQHQDDCAIAAAIIALGQSLCLKVVAEGVETEAQRDFLARHGCTHYQGYLFSRPVSAEQVVLLAQAQGNP